MRLIRSFAPLVFLSTLMAQPACWSDSDEPAMASRQQCERLRDHLIDLRMQSVTVDQEQHRAAMRSAFAESFVASCAETTRDADLKCALAAADSDALNECFESVTP